MLYYCWSVRIADVEAADPSNVTSSSPPMLKAGHSVENSSVSGAKITINIQADNIFSKWFAQNIFLKSEDKWTRHSNHPKKNE